MHEQPVSRQRPMADDRGEGVISTAVAVLIVAGLAALMWVGLREIWFEAESTTRDRVAEIGE